MLIWCGGKAEVVGIDDILVYVFKLWCNCWKSVGASNCPCVRTGLLCVQSAFSSNKQASAFWKRFPRDYFLVLYRNFATFKITKLKIILDGQHLENDIIYPKYQEVTVDPILYFTKPVQNLEAARNITCKTANSGCGTDPKTLRTAALALSYSTDWIRIYSKDHGPGWAWVKQCLAYSDRKAQVSVHLSHFSTEQQGFPHQKPDVKPILIEKCKPENDPRHPWT